MTESGERAAHWDSAYRTRGSEGVSWYQAEPIVSLQMIRLLGIDPSSGVIDVGGGASSLVDHLVADGFTDITVLDVSEVALNQERRRLGDAPGVTWLHQDIVTWQPSRRFDLWHDRAVFHFLTDEEDRARYLETLWRALEPGAGLIMATFAEDGPDSCSGLPVARYSAEALVNVLGKRFAVAKTQREAHTTPSGAIQPFTWVAGACR